MGLIIAGGGPVEGTMARGQTLAQKLAAIPGFIGAWNMAGIVQAPLAASWAAAVGSATFIQPTEARQPSIESVEGFGSGFVFGGTQCLYLPTGMFVDGEPLTVALKLRLFDPSIDIQFITALTGGVYRSIWRTGSGGRYQFDGVADAFVTPPDAGGNTDFYLNQTTTTTTLDIDGVQATAANPGTVGSQLVIGAHIVAASNGLRGAISRVVVARSATLGTDHEEDIRGWLAQ